MRTQRTTRPSSTSSRRPSLPSCSSARRRGALCALAPTTGLSPRAPSPTTATPPPAWWRARLSLRASAGSTTTTTSFFSMKASNPKVMVSAYRLLAAEMYDLGWDYPLHLGVTEAGEGEDGRMKSAIGIGSLLQDGLGDTIRVSLTEDPWLELEPCKRLKGIADEQREKKVWSQAVPTWRETTRDFKEFSKREGQLPLQKEGDDIDIRNVLHRDGSVISVVTPESLSSPDALYYDLGCKTAVGMPFKDLATSDSILVTGTVAADDKAARTALRRMQEVGIGVISDAADLEASPIANAIALYSLEEAAKSSVKLPKGAIRYAITVSGNEEDAVLDKLKGMDPLLLMLKVPEGVSRVHASRRVFESLKKAGLDAPVIHHIEHGDVEKDDVVLRTGSEVGVSLVDGNGDGVCIQGPFDLSFLRTTSFGLLQGSRMRNTKTEYVSCPSCGRTLFDLQTVTEEISKSTGHLPGVTIAVMGCIVNGPGEMADADFGYVGGAPGKIDLYVGKEVVQKAIPSEEAVEALIQLIKDNDRWVDKDEEEEEGAAEEPAAAAT
uniref:4-hydroxy-3-methylbut-2-en-1-yl diphosphate synthase n=1 Tax=Hemiselmis andersenii TaxID=464988 RepID=A0A7S0TXQ2_HEMAN|mmetsp:Transcript_29819/g.69637  ORF Transcript_29819/g.69637 Transcript_29819/m.69637 type:complete len:551 (+) Transcript_29819:613-2265(+)